MKTKSNWMVGLLSAAITFSVLTAFGPRDRFLRHQGHLYRWQMHHACTGGHDAQWSRPTRSLDQTTDLLDSNKSSQE